MDKFRDKYRIESTRLSNHNYSDCCSYFLTICTRNREHYFGECSEGEMKTSEIGSVVEKEWLRSVEIRADMNLKTETYIVMPNHFHAILTIGENIHNNNEMSVFEQNVIKRKNSLNKAFAPQYKNLSSVIRGFKSSVTMYARINKLDFSWQPSYYEHIIREGEYKRIKDYIINNPKTWDSDKFNNIKHL